jgi:hypothetical protein
MLPVSDPWVIVSRPSCPLEGTQTDFLFCDEVAVGKQPQVLCSMIFHVSCVLSHCIKIFEEGEGAVPEAFLEVCPLWGGIWKVYEMCCWWGSGRKGLQDSGLNVQMYLLHSEAKAGQGLKLVIITEQRAFGDWWPGWNSWETIFRKR